MEMTRLKMQVQLLFGGEGETVGELDSAVEVVAAAFRVEMHCSGMMLMRFLVARVEVEAMRVGRGLHADMARHFVARCAVMEAHVPADRDEQHHKGRHKSSYLQQPLFHGRKNTEKHNR